MIPLHFLLQTKQTQGSMDLTATIAASHQGVRYTRGRRRGGTGEERRVQQLGRDR